MAIISHDLSKLINSLKKGEKRHFKLFASHNGDNSDNKVYLKLFDAIAAILNKEKAIKPSYISRLKLYLYNLILRSLRNYNTNRSTATKLKEMLLDVESLYEKGLFSQCQKILKKAKQLAAQYEKHLQIFEIIHWERIIMRDKNFIGISKKGLEEDFKKEEVILTQFKNKIDYAQLMDSFLLFNVKFSSVIRSNKELKLYNKIFSHPLLSEDHKALSYDAKRNYYWMHARYNMIKGEVMSAYKYSKKMLELVEDHPEIVKEEPGSIITPLNTLIISQHLLKKYKEALITINKLRAISITSVSLQTKIFEQSYTNEFHLYIVTGAFEKGSAIIDEVKSGLKLYEENLNMEGKMIFYFNIAYIHFGVGDYNNAIEWANKILNETNIKIREDLHAVTRIFNLIIHFELGNESMLDSLVRSTYRFLYQRERLYKFETIVLDFIRKKLPKVITQKELLLVFKELKQELEEIIKDPFERKALEYFDFISWLESKIENKSFAEIVKEKA